MSASVTWPSSRILQRIEQFLAEPILAAAVIALRRKHADGVVRQLVAAKRGLAAPDRQDHVRRHAEFLLDGGEHGTVLGGEFLAALGKPRDGPFADVVGRGLDEFGLPARRLALAARQVEIGQLQIGLDPLHRGIEGLARDAHGLRLRPQALDPSRKGRIGRGASRRGREPGRSDQQAFDQGTCGAAGIDTHHFDGPDRPIAWPRLAEAPLQRFGFAGR